jgi:glycosyltransferase involved in cell wall biosynthesis
LVAVGIGEERVLMPIALVGHWVARPGNRSLSSEASTPPPGCVSVIVTTRNSGKTLQACLSSVRQQTVADIELIVVDNYSSDNTEEVGKRYADRFLQAGPERSRQRNLGANLASGDYLMFLDSDMVLQPTIVEECLIQAQNGVGAVVIPETSIGSGYWATCKALERSCYQGDDTIESPRFMDTGIFYELQGFDEDLTAGEDWDISARIRGLGVSIARVKTPLWHDEGRLRLTETMRAKFYYGRTIRRYMRKHPDLARGQLILFRPAFFRHMNRLARRPWITAGMILMKSSEMVAGDLAS